MGDSASETMDDISDYTTAFDLFDYARKLARGGKEGGFEIPGMTAVNVALDAYNVGNGVDQLVDGASGGDLQSAMAGVHDLLDGSAGLLSNAGGQLGAGATGFGAGFAIGDLMAPVIFDDVGEGKNDGPDEDGVYRPSTGNRVVDWVIDLF